MSSKKKKFTNFSTVFLEDFFFPKKNIFFKVYQCGRSLIRTSETAEEGEKEEDEREKKERVGD